MTHEASRRAAAWSSVSARDHQVAAGIVVTSLILFVYITPEAASVLAKTQR